MQTESDGPPRAILLAALLVAVGAVIAVLVFASATETQRSDHSPVAIPSAPAPQADSPPCRGLLADLPDALGTFERAEVIQPAPTGTAAWRDPKATDPVIMRCGMDRPAEFVVGSPIQAVNNVQWFQLVDEHSDSSTWVSVDRPVYVVLTLPQRSGPSPIQSLSDVIAKVMPAQPIRPGPPG